MKWISIVYRFTSHYNVAMKSEIIPEIRQSNITILNPHYYITEQSNKISFQIKLKIGTVIIKEEIKKTR